MTEHLPKTKQEARQWIRNHWAELISSLEMGAVGELANDHIDEVWEDECLKICAWLRRKKNIPVAKRARDVTE